MFSALTWRDEPCCCGSGSPFLWTAGIQPLKTTGTSPVSAFGGCPQGGHLMPQTEHQQSGWPSKAQGSRLGPCPQQDSFNTWFLELCCLESLCLTFRVCKKGLICCLPPMVVVMMGWEKAKSWTEKCGIKTDELPLCQFFVLAPLAEASMEVLGAYKPLSFCLVLGWPSLAWQSPVLSP